MNKKRILIIGDPHFREKLGYADYIKDGRKAEEQEVLDAIVKQSHDCDEVVFLGDNFNAKNNTSDVIKKFVVFLERFRGKQLYLISGNHTKHADGRTAIDFLKEINNPNWHVITTGVEEINGLTFLPYMTKPELDAKDDAEGIKKVMKMLPDGKILFAHHAISDSMAGVVSTNIFNEIVLPKTKLEKKFKLIIGGHIHTPQKVSEQIYIAGSIFNNEVGEIQKYVYKVNRETLKVESFTLPGRGLYKVENPSVATLEKIPTSSIVKVVMTNPELETTIPAIKEFLERFDAFLFLEQYPTKRKKIHFEKGMLDLKVENLLKIYAKEKDIDLKKLNNAWKLIK